MRGVEAEMLELPAKRSSATRVVRRAIRSASVLRRKTQAAAVEQPATIAPVIRVVKQAISIVTVLRRMVLVDHSEAVAVVQARTRRCATHVVSPGISIAIVLRTADVVVARAHPLDRPEVMARLAIHAVKRVTPTVTVLTVVEAETIEEDGEEVEVTAQALPQETIRRASSAAKLATQSAIASKAAMEECMEVDGVAEVGAEEAEGVVGESSTCVD